MFYTVVKISNYFMYKCSIFLIILHTLSCGRSILKCLAVDDAGSTSGLCFMRIGKMKTDKKNQLNGWIFIVQGCLMLFLGGGGCFFLFFLFF